MKEYPHQFSGGMSQRAMIAMAMSCRPKVLVADEPTTALDVTIQAQIFELMLELKDNNDTAILLITHDMGVVAELADDVAVMYMGTLWRAGTREPFSPGPPIRIPKRCWIPSGAGKGKKAEAHAHQGLYAGSL